MRLNSLADKKVFLPYTYDSPNVILFYGCALPVVAEKKNKKKTALYSQFSYVQKGKDHFHKYQGPSSLGMKRRDINFSGLHR